MILGQPLIFKRASVKKVSTKITRTAIFVKLGFVTELTHAHAMILKRDHLLYDADGIRRLGFKSIELTAELDRAQIAMRPHAGDAVLKGVASSVHSFKAIEPKDGGGVVLEMTADYEGDIRALWDYLLENRGVASLGLAAAQERLDLREKVEKDVSEETPETEVPMPEPVEQPAPPDEDVWTELVRQIGLYELGDEDPDVPSILKG